MPRAPARQLDSKWGPQLSAEERNWVWGVIGKQAAGKLSNDAMGYYANVSKDSDLSDDMLGWKVRAALRAGNKPRWADVLSAVNGMSDEGQRDPTWTYWKARALLATAANPSDKRTEALALLGTHRLAARLLRTAGSGRAGPQDHCA